MESKKTNKEEKLEKDLKTLVSRMKNENAALNKILAQLKSRENEKPRGIMSEDEPGTKKLLKNKITKKPNHEI